MQVILNVVVHQTDYLGKLWHAEYLREVELSALPSPGHYLWDYLTNSPEELTVNCPGAGEWLLRVSAVVHQRDAAPQVVCTPLSQQMSNPFEPISFLDEEVVAKRFGAPWRQLCIREAAVDCR